MLHPVSVKSYLVEGVWPHVRDDDWCGEWIASEHIAIAPTDAMGSLMQGAPVSIRVPASAAANAPAAVLGAAAVRLSSDEPIAVPAR